MILSANRKFYHETMLPKFISFLPANAYIIDVGVSESWGNLYQEMFKDFNYKTIDNNPKKIPDIWDDLEYTQLDKISIDAIIIMGVMEQCWSPYHLIQNAYEILKPNGLLLLGAVGRAYPEYSTDYQRTTDKGNRRNLKDFKILDSHIVGDEKNPEYLFYICQKP